MSDIQRDREERQHVIEVLKSWDGYFIGYTSDEVQEALRYAIASIRTDLKYDLLYEETSGQADKPTTKNDLSSGLKNGSPIIDWNNCHTSEQLDSISTTKNDLGVDFKLKDYVSREAVRRIIKSPRTQEQMLNALNSLRNATECKAEDCINRDYTAKYVEEFANNEYISQDEAETIYLIADGIRHIPSVLPKAEWIPVNERLPEDSGEYLVSVIDEYNEDQSYYKAVEVAWFAHKKDYDIKESEWRELGIDETVIAWMPLPKPYKAESEDKE